MTVWRLAKARYAALDGEGARLHGGRWNSPGNAVVYTSSTLSLAVLELLVHTDSDILPVDLIALEIGIPDGAQPEQLGRLPSEWRRIPAPDACPELGDEWIESGRGLILAVPSVVVPMELNYLINPSHESMRDVRVIARHEFALDPRLTG